MDQPARKIAAFVSILVAAVMILASPARAQQVPDEVLLEILVKTTLSTFNDANLTGNYAVMHAKMSEPFRAQFSPERLAEIFKGFRDQHVNLGAIVAKSPIFTEPAQINSKGTLLLYGYFDTAPSRVYYLLEFIISEGLWKPTRVDVNVKPVK
jgi:hypothetical protein